MLDRLVLYIMTSFSVITSYVRRETDVLYIMTSFSVITSYVHRETETEIVRDMHTETETERVRCHVVYQPISTDWYTVT